MLLCFSSCVIAYTQPPLNKHLTGTEDPFLCPSMRKCVPLYSLLSGGFNFQFFLAFVCQVAYGGNLLLDIGPSWDGSIPTLMQQRLLDLGAWLGTNGKKSAVCMCEIMFTPVCSFKCV